MSKPFLAEYRAIGPQAVRVERVLAVGRAFLTVTGLVTIYLDPTEPARFAGLTYTLLAIYALYSVGMLVAMRRATRLGVNVGKVLHAIDISWASVLTFFSEGPISPFFIFFIFVVVSAAYRWGLRETLATAGLTLAIYLGETLTASIGPWSDTIFSDMDIELSPVILRSSYLLLIGFFLGYLAEQEKQFRAEMLATTDAMEKPRLEIGLGGSVSAIARLFLRVFGASEVAVVITERENGRTLLWRTGGPAEVDRMRRTALTPAERDEWLFAMPFNAWSGQRPLQGTTMTIAGTAPDEFGGHAAVVDVPAPILSASPACRSLAAVDFGLANEWRGRIVLYDAAVADRSGERLSFLNTLASRVTPVLSNVFLLRRLRSRAGAAERARVARELHDGVIQALIGIEMQAQALSRETLEPPALTRGLTRIQQLLRDEVIKLRELMQELRPVDLDGPHQLPDVLSAVVERFRRDSGVSARFVAASTTENLSLKTATEIVRIVQEALVNVRKHSRARHVLIRLTATGGRDFALTIEDDGRGFDFQGRMAGTELEHPSVGPTLIKERVRVIGGRLEIESDRDHGSRLLITFAAEAHVA